MAPPRNAIWRSWPPTPVTAATRHSIPWDATAKLPALTDDVWELYNIDQHFSQANDLAKANPAKLKELQAVFMREAIRNSVLPIDDRRVERFNPAIAGRPGLGPRGPY